MIHSRPPSVQPGTRPYRCYLLESDGGPLAAFLFQAATDRHATLEALRWLNGGHGELWRAHDLVWAIRGVGPRFLLPLQ